MAKLKGVELTTAERDRLRVCFHEAGHAVAAVLVGGRIMRAEVLDRPRDGVRGSTSFVGVDARGDLAMLSWSGPFAEARWRFGPHPRLEQVRSVLRGSCDADDLATEVDLATSATPRDIEPQLERCWPIVRSLAGSLYKDGHVGHRAVCERLGLPLWGPQQRALVASIRAGLWTPPKPRGSNWWD
ncbi:hypothetical protein [Nocardia puris]|uniref:hypothetical protein n=1 Tax=Nocardia puris TaxID=208602 RepID=UPI002E24E330